MKQQYDEKWKAKSANGNVHSVEIEEPTKCPFTEQIQINFQLLKKSIKAMRTPFVLFRVPEKRKKIGKKPPEEWNINDCIKKIAAATTHQYNVCGGTCVSLVKMEK